MAHLIESKDTAMYAETAAWHGIGKVLDHCPGPDEALVESGLNWTVGKDRLWRARDGGVVDSHVETYRVEDGLPLGVVGEGYSPVQNKELFEIAYQVSGRRPDLKVESAFSMKQCTRVVVTVRADDFLAQRDDLVKMYLVFANGHDGSLVLSGYFSSTRVVCNNTFQASKAAAKKGEGYVSLRHEGDMDAKMKEAAKFLESYSKTYAGYREKVAALVKRKLTKDEAENFVLQAVMEMEGEIPTEADAAKTEKAAKKREKCIVAYRTIARNFDKEVAELKSDRNAWMILNACTKWMQHDRKGKESKDATKARDNKVFSEMFGVIAGAQGTVWDNALALV